MEVIILEDNYMMPTFDSVEYQIILNTEPDRKKVCNKAGCYRFKHLNGYCYFCSSKYSYVHKNQNKQLSIALF